MMNASNILQRVEQTEVEWKTVAEIFEIKNGYTPSKSNQEYWENGSIPWFRMEDIRENGQILHDALQKVSESAVKSSKLFPANSIIMATSATIGEHALVTVSYLANQRFTNLSLKSEFQERFEMKFLFYYCFLLADWCKKNTTMSSFASVDMVGFRKFEIPIPPISLQKEIVNILDKLTELKATLKATLKAELSLREKQYQYYRDYLLTSGDDVEWESLGEVVDIYLGLTYKPTYVENGVKFISAQNTSCDFLDLSDVKYISEQEYEKVTDNAKPKKGDVLFTRVGSNLGHPVIVETDERLCIFVSLGFLRVKDKSILLNSYLKYWMNTDLFWDQVNKNVHGSAKVNLNTGWLKKFKIPIPPLETQIKIVEILDKFDTLTQSISDGLPREIELREKQYQYYREKLLNFPKNPVG